MIEINIYYCLIQKRKIELLRLSAEEYYDPIESNESYEENAIPRFPHAFQYLNVSVEELKWTVLIVRGSSDDNITRTQFTQKGKGWMTHSISKDGFEEIIHLVILPDDSNLVIKTTKPPEGDWMVISSSIMDKEENIIEFTNIEYYYNNPDKLMPMNTEDCFAFTPKDMIDIGNSRNKV